jgi:hypothetical protein
MSWTPRYTLILSSIVALGYVGVILYFVSGLHGAYSVESTRLLLVLTLTIAMFGFGGLLIARALFAGEASDGFQNRFRLAREIFLVFSGIFGTIIGFYFGTSDEDSTSSPAVEIAYSDGQVTAAVTGGAEPFIGILTKKDEAGGEMMTASKRTLTYSATPCPEDASVLVVDGRGRRAEGSVKCGSAPAGEGLGNSAANQAAGNSVTNTAGNNTTNSD